MAVEGLQSTRACHRAHRPRLEGHGIELVTEVHDHAPLRLEAPDDAPLGSHHRADGRGTARTCGGCSAPGCCRL
eukprot:3880094-Pyramimonas_sp.AAC.1